jgi:hypothetical protein
VDIKELENLLEGTNYVHFIGHIKYAELNGYKYNDLLKIGNENTGFLALKIRKNDKNEYNENKYAIDSIRDMGIMKDKDDFVNKCKDIFRKNDYIIMVSDWLNGVQPIDNNREHLPKFYSLLAQFNKQNIVKGPYTSMYVYQNHFETIDDLVNWEINYHKKYFQEICETNEIEEVIKCLKNGLPCIILEDMNTGNLFVTDDGQYKYIDTDWIINGLNLYQFERIDYFGFDERIKFNVNEEARDCYSAYFETLGIRAEDANDQIRAFELLQVLRTNTCLICHGDDSYNGEEIKRRIKIVMGQDSFI